MGIQNISMREDAGADIVERLTGKRPPVKPDPTMLLTEEDWQGIAEESAIKIKEDFIVKYFLGIRNPEMDAEIDAYAKSRGCRVIDLIEHKKMGFSGVGPAEFLYLVKNSKANFVDSFHGAVFSVLFQKPFLAFCRPNQKEFGDMNSRFDTLFNTFGLESRFITCPEELTRIYDSIDYGRVQDILRLKRAEAEAFLNHALSMD